MSKSASRTCYTNWSSENDFVKRNVFSVYCVLPSSVQWHCWLGVIKTFSSEKTVLRFDEVSWACSCCMKYCWLLVLCCLLTEVPALGENSCKSGHRYDIGCHQITDSATADPLKLSVDQSLLYSFTLSGLSNFHWHSFYSRFSLLCVCV